MPVRKFEKKPVDDKLTGVLLHMAGHAASAGNLQAWEFIVVKDDDTKKKLAIAALRQEHVLQAPLNIVVCADLKKMSLKYQERGEFLYSIQDTASAVTIILLSATALGLGSDWVRTMDEESVKDILALPNELRPVAIIPIGYAKERPTREKLIPFERITWFDRYGQKYHIAEFFQPGPSVEAFKPIGRMAEEAIKKYKKEKKQTI